MIYPQDTLRTILSISLMVLPTFVIRHSAISQSAPLIVKVVPDGQKERIKHQFITALYGIEAANQTTQLTEIWDSNYDIILRRISAPIKIPAKRAAHIVNKLKFVPQEYHSYYDSLKHDAGDIVLNTSDIIDGDGPQKRKQRKKKASTSLSKKKSDQLAFIAARSGRSTDTAINIYSAVRSTILSAPALSSSTPGVALYSSTSVNPVIYC